MYQRKGSRFITIHRLRKAKAYPSFNIAKVKGYVSLCVRHRVAVLARIVDIG